MRRRGRRPHRRPPLVRRAMCKKLDWSHGLRDRHCGGGTEDRGQGNHSKDNRVEQHPRRHSPTEPSSSSRLESAPVSSNQRDSGRIRPNQAESGSLIASWCSGRHHGANRSMMTPWHQSGPVTLGRVQVCQATSRCVPMRPDAARCVPLRPNAAKPSIRADVVERRFRRAIVSLEERQSSAFADCFVNHSRRRIPVTSHRITL